MFWAPPSPWAPFPQLGRPLPIWATSPNPFHNRMYFLHHSERSTPPWAPPHLGRPSLNCVLYLRCPLPTLGVTPHLERTLPNVGAFFLIWASFPILGAPNSTLSVPSHLGRHSSTLDALSPIWAPLPYLISPLPHLERPIPLGVLIRTLGVPPLFGRPFPICAPFSPILALSPNLGALS